MTAPNNCAPSGYKVGYFRIPQWDKQENGLINGKPPVLEICLLPEEFGIDAFNNHYTTSTGKTVGNKGELAFSIPPEAIIIKVIVGSVWPDISKLVKKAIEEKKIKEAESDEYALDYHDEDLVYSVKTT